MKKFLIKLSYVLIPIMLFLSFIEIKLRSIPNDYSEKSEYLNQHAQEIETLILGSSLGWVGVNPDKIGGRVFNACFNAQTLEYDHFILEKYHNKFTSLKNVVLTVFYPSMEYALDEVAPNRQVFYSVYFDKFPPKLMFSLYNGSQITKRLLKHHNHPDAFIKSDSLGYSPIERATPENKNEQAERLVEFHTRISHKHRSLNTEHLQSIVQLCSSMKARLHIVLHPAQDIYRKNVDEEQIGFLKKTCYDMAKNHEVYFVDLFSDSRFDRNHFEDGIHLNENGATQLSKIIDELIHSRD